MFLNVRGVNEKIEVNRNYIITSLGRVYLNKEFGYRGKRSEAIDIAYEVLDKYYPKNTSAIKSRTVFVFERVIDNLDDLDKYFNLSSKFMEYLIDTKEQYWNRAIQNFRSKLSANDSYSLLKPVFFRYRNLAKNRENLRKVRSSLNNIQRYKKMVLYNVKYELRDNKLRLLEDFWINLTEIEDVKINSRYYSKEFECISLGNIKSFDNVEIEFDNRNRVKIKLMI